jgi:hypothetical protein
MANLVEWFSYNASGQPYSIRKSGTITGPNGHVVVTSPPEPSKAPALAGRTTAYAYPQHQSYSIDGISLEIFHRWNTFDAWMNWSVEYTDEFGEWYATLEAIQDDIARVVRLLEAKGPQIPYPYSSAIEGSRHEHSVNCGFKAAANPTGCSSFRSSPHCHSAGRWQ